ncbi:hypothetical protein [Pseudomonas putida]|uniref:hypothetical protein n=1 Tax=Pseudomonas putida TaxID=303 RepID=UPI003D99F822
MNDTIEQESDVRLDIDALRAILNSGINATPVLIAYLQAALAVLEAGRELPQAMSLTSEANSRKDPSQKARKPKPLGNLDSLGGGRLT